MKPRVASLLVAFAFLSVPVFAQGPPGGGGVNPVQALSNQLAALTARVSKLEGNIVASDLVGTYQFTVLDTVMNAAHPPQPASINTSSASATLTLNADGTGSLSNLDCANSTLFVGTGTMTGANNCGGETGVDVTWTYENGVTTITFLDDGDVIPFPVAAGGRLMIGGAAPFHPGDPSSDSILFIVTRLK